MVYVSDMRPSIKNKRWPYNQHCYLLADTTEELHLFAISIGLKRRWFQDKTAPHYDLTIGMRRSAVRKGATQISNKRVVELVRKSRKES